MYAQYVRYSPVGEYLRIVIMQRLARGSATVEELDKLAREAVEKVGIKYDWRVWPELLKREVVIKNGVAELTREGRWIYEQTREEVAEYLKKTLRLELRS
ncbi:MULTISPECIES: hypothetical protein [Pyrobaculum]|uniref:Uncharacterized protein n=2 Tax=Pyrobaculum arsenaticum TaxID=121277 RepID=A4WN70_PYRAR|nr:hypothetical protein [Pyrobaculum arsenaticum]ABP51837.1 conserved hypothetical protein [Pyrobaculum arsenaticum DSM 13514]MCY0891471.1 hypothetical protein [Pyrobaculum arsenaticum]NYR16155.1 hypothetical protein [Pyrobaculum arsenaticum]